MTDQITTVVLCLRSGGDFSFSDVELLASHLHKQWHGVGGLRVLCMFDQIEEPVELINVKLIPAFNKQWPGWWTKMNLFDPRMEQYRPFLYLDLDTAVVHDLEGVLPPTGWEDKFITLGGFFRPDTTNGLQSGLMWFPKNNDKIKKIWEAWIRNPNEVIKGVHNRGGDQGFIRLVLGGNEHYWQKITNKIVSFKISVNGNRILTEVPDWVSIVCFHGQPRIPKAALQYPWVWEYVHRHEIKRIGKARVTVIIPYKEDRGWLQEAINSVPQDVQLIVSQGNGNWPQNFNKVLDQAEGEFIKYLHDDDMLTVNCIEDSVNAIEEQGVDFIHGKALEIHTVDNSEHLFVPRIKNVKLTDLLKLNHIHSATTMYRRGIFEKLGGFDETLPDSEEYEFNLRCLHAGYKIGYCDSVLAQYRRHPKQQSVLLKNQLMKTSKAIANKYR
jgi:hypothetical protein